MQKNITKLKEAENKLSCRLPVEIFDFIVELTADEVSFGEETWIFGTINDKEDNFIIDNSKEFREYWELNGVVIAHNGVGDYLVLLPLQNGELSSAIYIMMHENAEIKLFSESIDAALKYGPEDYFWDKRIFYSRDEDYDETLTHRVPGDITDAAPIDPEAKEFLDLREKKSAIDDLIDDEETGRLSEILEGLDELTNCNDQHTQAWAFYKLSDIYFKGFGPLPRNIEKAMEYNEQAVDLGNLQATANRGFCFFAGIGVEKDLQKAYDLVKHANEESKKNMFMSALTGSKNKGPYENLLKIITDELKKEK
jgi:tetratricopeptide (TPR) repeat protein